MPSVRTCCITGTGGYLGGCLVRYFKHHGWSVIELNRTGTIRAGGDEARFYKLGDSFPKDLSHVSALIHAAYDFNPLSWEEIHKTNVKGTETLFNSARLAGVERLVHISSMSAYKGCRSLYGRAKLLSEDHTTSHGALSLRPGLIHDEEQPGGMVGKLHALVSVTPVVPLPGNGRNVLYLTHQEDLCQLTEEYSSGKDFGSERVIIAANPIPWIFKNILEELAKRQNRHLICIQTPWQLSFVILKTAELLRIPISFKSDSLLSLLNQDDSPAFNAQFTPLFRPF